MSMNMRTMPAQRVAGARTSQNAGRVKRPVVYPGKASQVNNAVSPTPQNVLEARAWIAAWQAKQSRIPPTPVVATLTTHPAPSGQKPAKEWTEMAVPAAPKPTISFNAGGNKWGTVYPDGSIVFTVSQLVCPDRTKAAWSRVKTTKSSGR